MKRHIKVMGLFLAITAAAILFIGMVVLRPMPVLGTVIGLIWSYGMYDICLGIIKK